MLTRVQAVVVAAVPDVAASFGLGQNWPEMEFAALVDVVVADVADAAGEVASFPG